MCVEYCEQTYPVYKCYLTKKEMTELVESVSLLNLCMAQQTYHGFESHSL